MTYSTSGTIPVSPNTQPIFIRRPLIATVRLTNQVCNRDPGTATPELLVTAGQAGALIESLEVYPLGPIIKTVLRLYYKLPYDTQYRIFRELGLAAVATAPSDDAIAGYPVRVPLPRLMFPASPDPTKPNDGLRVPAGVELRVALGTPIENGVLVTCFGGEYA